MMILFLLQTSELYKKVFWVSSVAPALPTKGTHASLSTMLMRLRLRFRMVRKASSMYSISPHILCNNQILNAIGIQDYFMVHEAVADDCLDLISKLLPLGITPPDYCSTPAKKARRDGEKDVSSR